MSGIFSPTLFSRGIFSCRWIYGARVCLHGATVTSPALVGGALVEC